MGLPPSSILLAPPRSSIDLDQWSLYNHDRACLADPVNAMEPGAAAAQSKRRRNSAVHIPLCILPKVKPDEEENVLSARPALLSAREVRELAKQKADELRADRLKLELRQQTTPRQPAHSTEAASASDASSVAPHVAPRFRRHSINLPPIRINDIAPPRTRPMSSPAKRSPPASFVDPISSESPIP